MKASELVRRIRALGWEVRLGPNDVLRVSRNCPSDLKRLLKEEMYCVTALLKEERASQRWKASGHDPQWWRDGELRAN